MDNNITDLVPISNEIVEKKPVKVTKFAKNFNLTVAVDAEWDASRQNTPICYQTAIREPDNTYYTTITLNQQLSEIPKECEEYNIFDVVEFCDLNNDTKHISNIILGYVEKRYGLEPLKNSHVRVDLLMFYSPNDLNISFGFEYVKEIYMNSYNQRGRPYIDKKRSLQGYLYTAHEEYNGQKINTKISYKIKDLQGWSNKGGLEELANSLSVVLPDKTFSEKYGRRMLDGFIDDKTTFLNYSKRDVTCLLEIQEKKVKVTNYIAQILGVDITFTIKSIPYTTGSLVNTLFENWINPQGDIKLALALRKLGMLNPTLPQKRKELIQKLHEELFYSDDPQKTYEADTKKYSILFKDSSYMFLAFSNSSITNFFLDSYKTNSFIGALIFGGRCHNERSYKYLARNIIDIDISSAYGSTLKDFDYPIGNPTTHTNTHNEQQMTLGEFLKRYREELVPGLYTIYVSGRLSFQQDLLYSKDVPQSSLERISQKISNKGELVLETSKEYGVDERDDTPHIQSDMILAKKELQNAVITHDLLDILEKISTKQEKREIMDLKVDTAVYYKKSDKISTREEWVDMVLKDKGKLYYNMEHQTPIDSRTQTWFPIPLKDFVGVLLEERAKYKQLVKNATTKEEKAQHDALQNAIKLVVNTLYGIIASPYFRINNTVLANNITGRCRAGMWLLAKALLINQSITDGGHFSVNDIIFLKENKKLPGLHTHADVRRLMKHKSTKIGTLGHINWDEYYLEPIDFKNFEKINELALNHVKNYFKEYQIEFPYKKIEYKPEHVAKIVGYIRKSDNGMLTADENGYFNQQIFKIRGQKHKNNERIPPKILIQKMIQGQENPKLEETTYIQEQIGTPKEFKRMHTRKEIQNNEIKIIPGLNYIVQKEYILNNTHHHVNTVAEYRERKSTKHIDKQRIFTETAQKLGYKESNILMEEDTIRKK